jgi:hypothetical protein
LTKWRYLGGESLAPLPWQLKVYIYTRKNLVVVVVESNLFFLLLLVILDFVPWSLTGSAIFDNEWTERRKWENQPATTALCYVNNRNTHTNTYTHGESYYGLPTRQIYTKQTNMTWHRL